MHGRIPFKIVYEFGSFHEVKLEKYIQKYEKVFIKVSSFQNAYVFMHIFRIVYKQCLLNISIFVILSI